MKDKDKTNESVILGTWFYLCLKLTSFQWSRPLKQFNFYIENKKFNDVSYFSLFND